MSFYSRLMSFYWKNFKISWEWMNTLQSENYDGQFHEAIFTVYCFFFQILLGTILSKTVTAIFDRKLWPQFLLGIYVVNANYAFKAIIWTQSLTANCHSRPEIHDGAKKIGQYCVQICDHCLKDKKTNLNKHWYSNFVYFMSDLCPFFCVSLLFQKYLFF